MRRHEGRDLTARQSRQWNGVSMDADDDGGKMPMVKVHQPARVLLAPGRARSAVGRTVCCDRDGGGWAVGGWPSPGEYSKEGALEPQHRDHWTARDGDGGSGRRSHCSALAATCVAVFSLLGGGAASLLGGGAGRARPSRTSPRRSSSSSGSGSTTTSRAARRLSGTAPLSRVRTVLHAARWSRLACLCHVASRGARGSSCCG